MAAVLCSIAVFSLAVTAERPNVLLIAIDDLRPQFGKSYATPEVLTPNLDKLFIDGGGSAMQHSYVQIAVCGPSRASILTGRRPDTTQVGMTGDSFVVGWCWCQRTKCTEGELFMTLPTYLRQHGYITAGNGKIFHPDACNGMDKHLPSALYNITHAEGDDKRAWSYYDYGVEANFTQEQWGTIPGPLDPVFNHTKGVSFLESPLSDEEQTDGILATYAIERFKNFSRDGIGKEGANKPFFHAVGFHKPHTPYIVPKKYFDMYDVTKISLPPNPNVPTGFQEHNWYDNGNTEMFAYVNAKPVLVADKLAFEHPIDADFTRQTRRAYYAAVSYVDSQVGRVLGALEQYGYTENTIVTLWSDHGYHLGDSNSWCKETNFESAARNTMMWRVPGQDKASQGLNTRMVEMIDWFPTLLELTSTPPIPKCEGIDQPPTVLCLQGESYASEFAPSSTRERADGIAAAGDVGKKYAFSQWPYKPTKVPANMRPYTNVTMPTNFRQGYTVRTSDGFRYTEYVEYDTKRFVGNWTDTAIDPELYDYNIDKWETTNFATNTTYAAKLAELKARLRTQYVQ